MADLLANEGVANEAVAIVTPAQSTRMLTLAARETMRYVYLRTGHLLPIQTSNAPAGDADSIVIAVKSSPILGALSLDAKTQADVAALESQQYRLKTVAGTQGHTTLVIIGGDDVGALYGTYRFIEHLGVRFYLHGDTIPDAQIPLALPALDETGKPLFALRGIQPFHDFPEGPDWWNQDDYLAYVDQLPKMRMIFSVCTLIRKVARPRNLRCGLDLLRTSSPMGR